MSWFSREMKEDTRREWARNPRADNELLSDNPTRFTMTAAEGKCLSNFFTYVFDLLQVEEIPLRSGKNVVKNVPVCLGGAIERTIRENTYPLEVYINALVKFAGYIEGPARAEFHENWELMTQEGLHDNRDPEDGVWPLEFEEPEEGEGDALVSAAHFLLQVARALFDGSYAGFMFYPAFFTDGQHGRTSEVIQAEPISGIIFSILLEAHDGIRFNHNK